MTEEEKKPEEPAKEPEADQPEKADPADLIEAAEKAAERLEAANLEHAKLLARQEKAIVENTFSGKADAGEPKKTKEEQEIENAKKLLEGTGMEEYAFPNAKTDNSYN